MKINRFIALAAIALLVVGAMGFVSTRSYAQSLQPNSSAAPVAQAPTCGADQVDGTEVQSTGPDTDTIDLQCGDQSTLDTGAAEASAVGAAAESAAGPDTDQLQQGAQSGQQVEDGQPDLPGAAPEAIEAAPQGAAQ
jgi:hypothetical protein